MVPLPASKRPSLLQAQTMLVDTDFLARKTGDPALPSFQPRMSSFGRLRSGIATKRNAVHACIRTCPSHHHRDSHRTSNHEHHLFGPPSRHGRLSSLQVRAARRRSCGCDTSRTCGCICRDSACTNNGNCCDDGLTAIRKCARVHDGAGRGRLRLAARCG